MAKRLSEAQKRWLEDSRPYVNENIDRTCMALLRKGFIKITSQGGSGWKSEYEVTPAGREALRASLPSPLREVQ